MKTQYTTPKDWQFFQSYAGLLSTLNILGYLAQFISALTEFGVIYTLVRQSIAETFPAYAIPAALTGAVLCTAFLEVGLRRFLPFAFRAIYFRRFSGLHLAITLPVLLVASALIIASGYLSVHGSREIVQQSTPLPRIDSELPYIQQAEQDKAAALALWTTDSFLLEKRFASKMESTQLKHQSIIQREISVRRSQGSNLPSFRRAELEADYQTALAVLEQQKADAFQKAQDLRDTRFRTIESEKAASIARVDVKNKLSEHRTVQKSTQYGNGLAWFTLLAMGVLIFSIGIQEAHRKGSGIEEVAVLRSRASFTALLDELTQAISSNIEQQIRTWIRRLDTRRKDAITPSFSTSLNTQPALASPAFTLMDETYTQNCKQCHAPYLPKTTWQKYCSTECRMAFHEAKHGKKYLPAKVYRAQQRTDERK
jgi:hypothetical protein